MLFLYLRINILLSDRGGLLPLSFCLVLPLISTHKVCRVCILVTASSLALFLTSQYFLVLHFPVIEFYIFLIQIVLFYHCRSYLLVCGFGVSVRMTLSRGVSIGSLLSFFPVFPVLGSNAKHRFPLSPLRTLVVQVLMGCSFLI
jgi:hypothetical protein